MLDKKDCVILNTLQENCRVSLTYLAAQTELSVDSVKKRVEKLKSYFHPAIQIRPRRLGFPNIVDVKIKFNTHSQEGIQGFIEFLMTHSRISEVFTVSGDWDASIVIISKDVDDLDNITREIKQKFGAIIGSWSASTTLKVYKFEKYDLHKLMGHQDGI